MFEIFLLSLSLSSSQRFPGLTGDPHVALVAYCCKEKREERDGSHTGVDEEDVGRERNTCSCLGIESVAVDWKWKRK